MRKENLIFGAVIGAVGYTLSAFSAGCGKLLGDGGFSPFTILFFQNVICLVFTLPEIAKDGLSSLKTERIGLHLVRGVTGFVCLFLFYTSLKHLPLADGVLLLYTGPLWIPFIALIYPRIKIKGHTWWGILIGFLGVVFILRPGLDVFNLAALTALASGVLSGFASIVVRRLSHTDSTNQILFYYFLFSTLVSAPYYFLSKPALPTETLYLVGVGLYTYLSQSFSTTAFRHGSASVLGPLSYIAIVVSGILGWLFWDDVPDAVACIGMALVILGGIVSIYFERRYEKRIEVKKVRS